MRSADERPNVLLILADDLGYSDLGCYGGEIHTPHLDRLGRAGTRFTQFYNTARCSPSRASLLTGLHPHQTGIGILAKDDRPGGYAGSLNQRCTTLAEELSAAGYRTGLSGKWHLSAQVKTPDDSWPTRRGFDHFFGTITGCGSYFQPGTLTRGESPVPHEYRADEDWYFTEAIGDDAAQFIAADDGRPFFHYLAFTAPHWPLHARQADIDAYDGVYDAGWDRLRETRQKAMIDEGILAPDAELSPADPEGGICWDDAPHQEWEARRMQTYAAMVESMDQQIGRVLAAIEAANSDRETIVLFLSDNGGCAEYLPHGDPAEFEKRRDIFPGTTRDGRKIRLGNYPEVEPGVDDSYMSYGQSWANLSNTPHRFFKRWLHEGGISTPLIVGRVGGSRTGADSADAGRIVNTPYQLTDIVPTVLDLVGIQPRQNSETMPLKGRSMVPTLRGEDVETATQYWEHIGNAAIRRGTHKLVRERGGDWELYDIEHDRVERNNLSADQPDLVAELAADWQRWADEIGVIPWQTTVKIYEDRGLGELEAFS